MNLQGERERSDSLSRAETMPQEQESIDGTAIENEITLKIKGYRGVDKAEKVALINLIMQGRSAC